MKKSDLDIMEACRERSGQAAKCSPPAVGEEQFWTCVLDCLGEAREARQSSTSSAVEAIMRRWDGCKPPSLASRPSFKQRLDLHWRGLAIAATVLAVAGGLLLKAQQRDSTGLSEADRRPVHLALTSSTISQSGIPLESRMTRAVESVESGGILEIEAGATAETLRIARPLTLKSVRGVVRIGDQSAPDSRGLAG